MDIYYAEWGSQESPLIVFIHGGGIGGWMWDRQVSDFTGYHIIVPDLPGHGKSKSIRYESIRDSAERIIRIIDEKASGRDVTLVGLSHGGQIAIEIMCMRPDIARCAVINSALAKPMMLTGMMVGPMIRAASSFIGNRRFARIQAKTLYIDDDHFDTYYEDTKEMSISDLERFMKANMVYSLPAEFKDVTARTLVLIGSEEKGIMRDSAMGMLEANEGCSGYEVAGIGHGIPLADPELFNEAVHAWMEGRELPSRLIPLVGGK